MLIVLKYGGNAMTAGAEDPVLDEITALANGGTSVVLVHGGGPQIDAALRLQGIPEERVEGLRVTSAAARDVDAHRLADEAQIAAPDPHVAGGQQGAVLP